MSNPLSSLNTDSRQQALQSWCEQVLNAETLTLSVVSGDASFRRYFRCLHQGVSYIAVDAPPDKEDSSPFVALARHWQSHGIAVPDVVAADLAQGFMLLSDFGDALLLPKLQQGSTHAEHLYPQALQAAVSFTQLPTVTEEYAYPVYDAALLRREMQLFDDWFYQQHLGFSEPIAPVFEALQAELVDNALAQPQVVVHRDYHSRNIMLLDNQSDDARLGIIDFQDAVVGAVTYDAVSLLKDCYIAWPREQVVHWLAGFYAQLSEADSCVLPESLSFAQFTQWFDLMGLQRHIKVAGIFCRLSYRDGKSAYLDDLPLVLAYIADVCGRYAQLIPAVGAFSAWFADVVLPAYFALAPDNSAQVAEFVQRLNRSSQAVEANR